MNPFAMARMAGHTAEEVMNFLKNIDPKLAKKIKGALSMGYGAEEIMNFLGGSFDSESAVQKNKQYPTYAKAMQQMNERAPESVKQQEALRERDTLEDILDPAQALAAGAGALAGGIPGAMGGVSAYRDLRKRYDDHVKRGGQLSFADFVKAATKGIATAGASRAIPGLVEGFMGGEDQTQQPQEQPVAQEPVVPQAQAPISTRAQDEEVSQQAPQQAGLTPEQAFKALDERGLGGIMKTLGKQLDADSIRGAVANIKGKKFVQDLEKTLGVPATEIFEKARQHGTGDEAKQEVQQEIEQEEQFRPDVKFSQGSKDLTKYLSSIGSIEMPKDAKLTKDAKPLQALKSSNVRYADYNPENQTLQVLFAPTTGKSGMIYEYNDVPEEDVLQMMKGSGTAVTKGANSFRAWFSGKNPSIGRAFKDFIAKKDENGDAVYPYRQIAEKYVKDEDLKKIREADRVHLATQYFDAFEDLTLKSQAKTRAEGMKMLSQSLKDFDDTTLEDMIFQVTKAIGSEVKKAKRQGKQKRYKGGREQEIESRVKQMAGIK